MYEIGGSRGRQAGAGLAWQVHYTGPLPAYTPQRSPAAPGRCWRHNQAYRASQQQQSRAALGCAPRPPAQSAQGHRGPGGGGESGLQGLRAFGARPPSWKICGSIQHGAWTHTKYHTYVHTSVVAAPRPRRCRKKGRQWLGAALPHALVVAHTRRCAHTHTNTNTHTQNHTHAHAHTTKGLHERHKSPAPRPATYNRPPQALRAGGPVVERQWEFC